MAAFTVTVQTQGCFIYRISISFDFFPMRQLALESYSNIDLNFFSVVHNIATLSSASFKTLY